MAADEQRSSSCRADGSSSSSSSTDSTSVIHSHSTCSYAHTPASTGSSAHSTQSVRQSSSPAAGSLLWLLALLCCVAWPPGALAQAAADGSGPPPLKFAIVNQVHFHLEVVAGAMHVLSELTSEPVHIYLPAKVLKTNWYGFFNWMGSRPGVVFRECKDYAGHATYDLVWFPSPEYHIPYVKALVDMMKPKVVLYMAHNAHTDQKVLDDLQALNPSFPLVTLAPHVAKTLANRTKGPEPQWILPIYPFRPAKGCGLQELQQADSRCLQGFSVQGRIESTRRNYTAMWEQIHGYSVSAGKQALKNFRLNILGESVEMFTVPANVREYVAVYKNPPYPIFYDVVYHSYALVPMIANELYYHSKFSSTVLTSMITGSPMIADEKFMAAYSMIDRSALIVQKPGENELDVMFDVMKQDAETLWRTRLAVAKQRDNFNARAKTMITDWLAAKGLKPDPNAAKASKQVVSAKDLPQETPTAAALAAVELLNTVPLNTAGVTKSAGPLKRHHRPNAARRRNKLNQHNN